MGEATRKAPLSGASPYLRRVVVLVRYRSQSLIVHEPVGSSASGDRYRSTKPRERRNRQLT